MFETHESGAARHQTPPVALMRRLPQLGLVAGGGAAVLIGALTLTPVSVPYAATLVSIDKLYHFVAFAGLVFPVVATGPQRWLWVAPLAIAYGGAIELIQPHLNRTGTWADFFANTLGVAAGVWLGHRAHRWLHARLAAASR